MPCRTLHLFAVWLLALFVSGCGGFMKKPEPPIEAVASAPIAAPTTPEQPTPAPPMPEARAAMPPAQAVAAEPVAPRPIPPARPAKKGAYFQSDGPGDIPPEALQHVPEPIPRDEPLAAHANRPYQVFGRRYTPAKTRKAERQRGVATWYGKQFHGRKTSIGERYDMYALSAAHPTLPLPSYVRVTNLANKRSIIVRVNDRGPFTGDRILDLSYAAAAKLGFVHAGSARVEVETIVPTLVAQAP